MADKKRRVNYNAIAKTAFDRLGWTSGVVETRRQMGGIGKDQGASWGVKVDLFGFADFVAVGPGITGTKYLQITSKPNITTRVRKVMEDADRLFKASKCLASGNTVEFWGFHKIVLEGTKQERWEARRIGLVVEVGGTAIKSVELVSYLVLCDQQSAISADLGDCPEELFG